jgi:hypothetical protein
MNRSSAALGGVFVIIGAILLAAKYLFGASFISLGPDDFWPMIILMTGVMFELVYFVTLKAPGFLVPGGILITYGILFFFEAATDFHFAQYTWPVYILGVAIGLFQLYLFSGRPKGVLIAVSIIAGVATVSLIVMLFRVFLGAMDFEIAIPAVLIVIGLLLLFSKGKMKGTGA